MVTWAAMVYSGKVDVTHFAGWTWFTSLISIHFSVCFDAICRDFFWHYVVQSAAKHEIHESFNFLIQDKFQRWVLWIRYNETMPSNMFFLDRPPNQKGKGQVKGNVCRQLCASLALAHQMFHIPCRPERNPDHPEAMLPDSKTLWSRLTLVLNLTQWFPSFKYQGLRPQARCEM